MALQMDETLDTGVQLAAAYLRVDALYTDDKNGAANVVVRAYANQAAYASGKTPIWERLHRFAGADVAAVMGRATTAAYPTVRDVVKNGAYLLLKTLPDYASAQDV